MNDSLQTQFEQLTNCHNEETIRFCLEVCHYQLDDAVLFYFEQVNIEQNQLHHTQQPHQQSSSNREENLVAPNKALPKLPIESNNEQDEFSNSESSHESPRTSQLISFTPDGKSSQHQKSSSQPIFHQKSNSQQQSSSSHQKSSSQEVRIKTPRREDSTTDDEHITLTMPQKPNIDAPSPPPPPPLPPIHDDRPKFKGKVLATALILAANKTYSPSPSILSNWETNPALCPAIPTTKITSLSQDEWSMIFSYCNKTELLAMALVCKQSYQYSTKNLIWKPFISADKGMFNHTSILRLFQTPLWSVQQKQDSKEKEYNDEEDDLRQNVILMRSGMALKNKFTQLSSEYHEKSTYVPPFFETTWKIWIPFLILLFILSNICIILTCLCLDDVIPSFNQEWWFLFCSLPIVCVPILSILYCLDLLSLKFFPFPNLYHMRKARDLPAEAVISIFATQHLWVGVAAFLLLFKLIALRPYFVWSIVAIPIYLLQLYLIPSSTVTWIGFIQHMDRSPPKILGYIWVALHQFGHILCCISIFLCCLQLDTVIPRWFPSIVLLSPFLVMCVGLPIQILFFTLSATAMHKIISPVVTIVSTIAIWVTLIIPSVLASLQINGYFGTESKFIYVTASMWGTQWVLLLILLVLALIALIVGGILGIFACCCCRGIYYGLLQWLCGDDD